MSEKSETPAPIGPRMIHPLERAAIRTADDPAAVAAFNRELFAIGVTEQVPVGPSRPVNPSPTTVPPALVGSGPTREAESGPAPLGEASGAQNATGGAEFPMSAAERELRKERDKARAAELTERDRADKSERLIEAICGLVGYELRKDDDNEDVLKGVRAAIEAEHAQHAAFLRAFRFPTDAHPLIAALMERMVRVMGMEAAGGACNPHAVVCAALDAAHTFAAEDGAPATARLRDIVRVSVAEVDRLKDRDQDATHYHAEWMRERGVAEALAAEIGDKAAFKAVKRAKARAAREAGQRVAALLKWDADNAARSEPRDDTEDPPAAD